MKMKNVYDEKLIHPGLLIMRIGLGIMFMLHGGPKMIGGPEVWSKVGTSMSHLGINFLPVVWGFMAGFSELVGGFLLLLGLFHRIACFFIFMVMVVASFNHYLGGDNFVALSHPIEAAIVFLALIIMGPGKYSIDFKLSHKKPKY